MHLIRIALASLANRRFTALLTVFAIALSVCLLLAVERVRTEARASFANTISGTDLIVGARTGPVQLMLYAVFRVGGATNNIRMSSAQALAEHATAADLLLQRRFPVQIEAGYAAQLARLLPVALGRRDHAA